jgi:hypothetical protein
MPKKQQSARRNPLILQSIMKQKNTCPVNGEILSHNYINLTPISSGMKRRS